MESGIYTGNPLYNTKYYQHQYESVLKPRRFYHTGFEHTLENILSSEPLNNKSSDKSNFLERIFSDKRRTLKATIKALFNEIMLRENLDSFLLYRIKAGKSENCQPSLWEI